METEIVNCNIVWATLHENSEVTTKVKKYQIHTYQSPRCYKYGKNIFSKCKYSFPFELCNDNYLDEENNLYKYKRINEVDKKIVPYHPPILLLWDGHMNVQYVTKKGLEQYLVKYRFIFSLNKLNAIACLICNHFHCILNELCFIILI